MSDFHTVIAFAMSDVQTNPTGRGRAEQWVIFDG
jgi:hypothetical protein